MECHVISRTRRVFIVLVMLLLMTSWIYPQAILPHCIKLSPILVLRDANSPSISADGKRIAVEPRIGLSEVYEVPSGRKLQTFRVQDSFGSQLSDDGRELAIFAPLVPHLPCRVLFFDVDTGREIRRSTSCVEQDGKSLGALIIDNVENHSNMSSDLRLIAGPANPGMFLGLPASNRPGVLLWDISRQKLDRTFGEFVIYDEYNFDLWKEVRLTPDGRILAASRFNRRSENLETMIWDTRSGRVLLRLPFASRYVALSDDGRRVVATRERPMTTVTDTVSLAVNPKGQVLANSSAGATPNTPERPATEVWDIETQKRIAEIGEYRGQRVPITGLAFSPDGKLVATESLVCVLVWDADSGKLRQSLLNVDDRDDRVRSVAFSADGRYLVTSSRNEVVQVWSVADLIQR